MVASVPAADEVGHWTEARLKVLELLSELDPEVGKMYKQAVDLLGQHGERTLTQVMLVAHCMRELLNCLPELLADDSLELPQRAGPDVWELAKALPDLLKDDVIGRDMSDGEEGDPTDQSIVGISRVAFDRVIAISAEVQRGSLTRRQRDALVISRDPDATGPTHERWSQARDFFMSWAHFDRASARMRTRGLPSDAEILDHLAVIENVLRSRLAGFFDTSAEVEDLLRRVNGKG